MNKRILHTVGYVVFTLFAVLFFVYMTFPIDAVRGRINKELEKQFPQAHVSFATASPYRLSGLDIEDVSITLDQPGDKPAISMRFDRVRARLQILPLLRKHYNVAFDVTLGDGSLSGVVGSHAEGLSVQVDANELDLGRPPVLGKFIGTTFNGDLTMKLDLNLDFNDPKKSTGGGFVELKKTGFGELVVNNITPMMPGAFTIPATSLGSINITVEVKDGQLLVKNFTQKSEDLELKVTGDMTIRKQLNQTGLNLQLNYKLMDSYTQKNGKMALLAMKKGPDGFTTVKVGGTVGAPAPQL